MKFCDIRVGRSKKGVKIDINKDTKVMWISGSVYLQGRNMRRLDTKVSTKSMSLFGWIVVELGREPIKDTKGSSIPRCNHSHSMEYGLIEDSDTQSADDWCASSIKTMAWLACWSSLIFWLCRLMASCRGQAFLKEGDLEWSICFFHVWWSVGHLRSQSQYWNPC